MRLTFNKGIRFDMCTCAWQHGWPDLHSFNMNANLVSSKFAVRIAMPEASTMVCLPDFLYRFHDKLVFLSSVVLVLRRLHISVIAPPQAIDIRLQYQEISRSYFAHRSSISHVLQKALLQVLQPLVLQFAIQFSSFVDISHVEIWGCFGP